MSATQFSVLMSVYRGDDAAHFRKACHSAVAEQSRRPAQLVLIQDGPVSDELAAEIDRVVAESPVPVAFERFDRNEGLTKALSVGLELSDFDVVARMDADDISLPTRFERQLPMIESGADLVGSGMLEFLDDVGSIVGKRVPPTEADEIRRYARFHDPFSHPTVVYRRSAVLDAGGYQPMGLMEDYWLFARMIANGAEVANLAEPLVMYRVGAGAYHRRGGLAQWRSELALQRAMRRLRFTSSTQFLRNVLVRGGYRFVPVGIRQFAYRRFIADRSTGMRAGGTD